MVDEHQLEVLRLRLRDLLGAVLRVHDHAVGHVEHAARHELREVVDLRRPVVVEDRLLRLAVHEGCARFDEALPAVGRRAQGRVIAEVRDLGPTVQAVLEQLVAGLEVACLTVDDDLRHVGMQLKFGIG